MTLPRRLGVVGAGTMGAGIAQLGALAGIETHVHDPIADALAAGIEKTRANLAKGAERGRWSAEDADAAAGRLHTAATLEGLEGCDFVIEAAPERLDLKRELFQALSAACGPDAVLATNTSSIPVTFLAPAAARAGERGRHALLQPSAAHAARRGDPRPRLERRGHRCGPSAGRGDGQAGDPGGRRARISCQPLRPSLLHRGAAAAPGARGHTRADRPDLPPRRRLPDGAVRADGHGGHRRRVRGREVVHRAELRRASLEAEPDPGADGARRPPRPQERARLLRLQRASTARPTRIPSSLAAARTARSRSPATARSRTGSRSADERPATRSSGKPARSWRSARSDCAPMLLCADRSLRAHGDPDAVGFNVVPPVEASQLVELTGPAQRAGRAALEPARLPRRVGRGRARAGARPDRHPARERGDVRGRREGVGSPEDVDAGLELGLNHPRGAVGWGG